MLTHGPTLLGMSISLEWHAPDTRPEKYALKQGVLLAHDVLCSSALYLTLVWVVCRCCRGDLAHLLLLPRAAAA